MWQLSVYGLTLQSEFPLPGWTHGRRTAADVLVRFGATPEHLPGALSAYWLWQSSAEGLLFRSPSVGRFLVRGGTEIIVTPNAAASETSIHFALLQGAVNFILHQRGTLMLHASALHTHAGAVAIAGASGAGKSTLLAACLRRGARMIADDVAALDVHDDQILVQPGLPFVHLWRDSAEQLGCRVDTLDPVRPHGAKYRVRPPGGMVDGPTRLTSVFFLSDGPHHGVRCARLEGGAGFAAVRAQTRGLRLAESLNRRGVFRGVSKVANRIPLFQLDRPRGDFDSVEALADRVLEAASS